MASGAHAADSARPMPLDRRNGARTADGVRRVPLHRRNWRVFLLFRYLKSHRLSALRINKISRNQRPTRASDLDQLLACCLRRSCIAATHLGNYLPL